NQGVLNVQNSNDLGRVNAVQQLVLGGALGGSFSLQLGGVSTVTMVGSGLSAATLQANLEALPTIGGGNVLVENFAPNTFRITFRGLLADQNIATLGSTATGGITATMSSVRTGQSGATTVSTGAELQLQGGLVIGNEPLTLNGLGLV